MTYSKHVDKVKNFLMELFFPSFCLGCKKEGTHLCQDCKSILEISEYNYCLCNKNPIRIASNEKSGRCNRCNDKKLSGLYFALPYKEKSLTRKLVHKFKYEPYIKDLAKNLAGILIEHFILTKNINDSDHLYNYFARSEYENKFSHSSLPSNYNPGKIWENSVLIPIPMEKKKQKDRGYNQAEELVKELSKVIKVPVVSDNLIKTKPTLPQIKLSAKDREENLKGAFKIKNPTELADKKIFLVDDVYTTGSTMEECSRVLRDAGAKQVWGIAVAREG